MNARIEKKLSKRMVQLFPNLMRDAWVLDDECSERAYKQGSSITHCYHVGGGIDYWGEGQDSHSVWEWWSTNWCWFGCFPEFPSGHRFAHYPDTTGFKATVKNLFKLAGSCEIREKIRQENIQKEREEFSARINAQLKGGV